MTNQTFTELFRPESIAVIGATDVPGTAAFKITRNLVKSEYDGKVMFINPLHTELYGRTCYRHLRDIPEVPDLAVLAVATEDLTEQAEICGKAGIKAVMIVSGGYREADEGASVFETELTALCRHYGMNMLGPESFGFQTPDFGLNLSLFPKPLQTGSVAFISQSKAVSEMVAEWAYYEHIGFSYFISGGMMTDIHFYQIIDFLSEDFRTECILLYMETLDRAREFLSAAREYTRRRPIVVFKAGKTLPGADIIYSNRGFENGTHAIFSAAFRRVGIIEVHTLLQLFNSAEAFGKQKKPEGNRLAIVTNAASPGIVATDYLLQHGGSLANFSDLTLQKLSAVIPLQRRISNPVDLYAAAGVKEYQKAVLSCLYDANTDAVLVIYTPTKAAEENKLANILVKIARSTDKTVLVCWISRRDKTESKIILENGDLPVYHFPENAVNIFLRMYESHLNEDMLYETPSSLPEEFTRNRESARLVIENALRENRTVLNEAETQRLLSFYGIHSPENRTVHTLKDALAAAKIIGYPVVLKLLSSRIEHISEVGGVHLNIGTSAQLKTAFQEMQNRIAEQNLSDKTEGILVEKMVHKDYELYVSAEKHPVFGPAIRFGMGGVAYDIYDDKEYGLPPLNMALARRMIENTRIYKLLRGYRGSKPVRLTDVQFFLYRFSYLVTDFPQLASIAINPFAIDEDGGIVLNARAVLDPHTDPKKGRYHHLVISPYPEEFVSEVQLRSGITVTLRPIRAEDEDAERELLENLSDRSLYLRFFSKGIKVTHQMLSRFTNIDYDREIALVAEFSEENGRKHLAGAVRLALNPNGKEGEFAIAVRDDWHGRGVGSKLTNHILEVARTRGVRRIHATLLSENEAMLKLFKTRGFRTWKLDEDTIAAEKFL